MMCVCHTLHSNPSPPTPPPTPKGSLQWLQVILKNSLKHVITLDYKEKMIFLKWILHLEEVARPHWQGRWAVQQRKSWNSRTRRAPSPSKAGRQSPKNPKKSPSSMSDLSQASLQRQQPTEQPWKWMSNGTFLFMRTFCYRHNTAVLSQVCI